MGAMAIHAAREYGASVVGVTLSEEQRRYAVDHAEREGVSDLVEFRLQDFATCATDPSMQFLPSECRNMSDASHWRRTPNNSSTFFVRVDDSSITRSADPSPSMTTRPSKVSELSRQMQIALGLRGPSKIGSPSSSATSFHGELQEVGTMVSMFEAHGFEVRHLESLREHYALTLRHWVANLAKRFDEAVGEVGEERARVWRLYMSVRPTASNDTTSKSTKYFVPSP